MQSFIQRFGSKISGVLSGFDRVRFRGTLRRIANLRGLGSFLYERRVLLKDFTSWAKGLSNTVTDATKRLAEIEQLPIHYLNSSALRKEQVAQEVSGERWNQEGLQCILS